MERRSGKRSSSVGSEKMERVGDRSRDQRPENYNDINGL
jgi:hypothetical protein